MIAVAILWLSAHVNAANVSSVANGNWSSKCTWSVNCNGSVPTKNDNISIYHNVVLDVDLSGGNQIKGTLYIAESGSLTDQSGGTSFSMKIQNLGSLVIDGSVTIGGDLELQGDATLTVTAGSTLTIEGDASWSAGANILVEGNATVNINGSLTIDGGADSVQIDGTVNVGGNFTNGSSAEVSGDGLINIGGSVTNNGEIFNEQGSTVNCSDCSLPNGTLPVEFSGIDVEATESGNLISWSTSMEIDNDYFEVQRQENGIWVAIGTIQGAGYSEAPLNYSFLDVNVTANSVFYYRIKQNDFNGDFMFSPIVSVQSNIEAAATSIEITNGEVWISKNADNITQVVVTNINGQIISNTSFETTGFSRVESGFDSNQIVVVSIIENGTLVDSKKVAGLR